MIATMMTAVLAAGLPAAAQDPATAKEHEFVAASNRFGFSLAHEVDRIGKGKNVLLSPPSVFLALSMAAAGAQGTTQADLARALELKGKGIAEIDMGCAAFLELLRPPEGVRLEIANSAWARTGFPFHAAYLQRLRDSYLAAAFERDFADPATRTAVDDWVRERTAGKILEACPPLGADDILLLVNAVSFKGGWSAPFDKTLTKDDSFQAEREALRLPFMNRTGEYRTMETPEFKAIRIPYGKDGRVALYVFVPLGTANPSGALATLARQAWRTSILPFQSRRCRLGLPRFKLTTDATLNDPLSLMGMKSAFTGPADFRGMAKAGSKIRISSVTHKAFIDVNEEGAEAAAATVVKAAVTSVPPPPLEFKVDRPFVLVIADDATGALWFVGLIVDPR